MRRIAIATLVLGFVVGFSLPAVAQTAQFDAWGDNGYLGFSGLYQTSSSTFEEDSSYDLNQELATVSAAHEIEPGFVWEFSAGGHVYKQLGFGFAVSYFKRDDGAHVAASLPHPFFFEQPRSVSGDATGLEREELGIHLDAMFLLPLTERFQISVFGGPSFFRLNQELVDSIQVAESYPYDEAEFSGVNEGSSGWEWSNVGYNVGAEASVFFTQYIGVGASIRYSDADVEFDRSSGPLQVKVGGLQVGGGLRIRY
jgi:hypothetical protein